MPVAILPLPRFFRHAALLLLFISGITVHVAQAQGNPCLPLTDIEKVKIVAYLTKWIGVPETEKLEIADDELVPGTCYRRLVVKGRILHPRSFFLSPDQRFLSGALLDITVDPAQERKQAQEEINKVLLSEPSPTRGTAAAPVTIVEFADFECTFCKRFYEWTQLLAAEKDFRLIFKNLPLQGHVWARDASALAICAETQSNSAFWHLHDFFYANQATLNAENLEGRVMQYVGTQPTIDGPLLLNCAHEHRADARITRDAELASMFRINATPTIFVNGMRMGALESENDLRSIVDRAMKLNSTGGDK